MLLGAQWNGDEWIILVGEALIRFLPLDIPFCTGIHFNCWLEKKLRLRER